MAIFLLFISYIIFGVSALPNFVVVLTDDQDLILDGLVSKYKENVTFNNCNLFRNLWKKRENYLPTEEKYSKMR